MLSKGACTENLHYRVFLEESICNLLTREKKKETNEKRG